MGAEGAGSARRGAGEVAGGVAGGCLTLLGSTGSIGRSTLAVVAANPNWSVHGLTAFSNWRLLAEQCRRHHPRVAVVGSEEDAGRLAAELRRGACATEVLWGAAELEAVAAAAEADTVMAAVVGAAGLPPTLAAARAGKRVLLANKEALVMSGGLFMTAAAASGSEIIPVDSEHNGLFQCLATRCGGSAADQVDLTGISKLALTASGGPFLKLPLAELPAVTPAQACAHPTWQMGRKISVDSATMMNKGLEIIEACHLFAIEPARVDVLIHPQSIVHALVFRADGSVLAQLANPDMRVPIAAALGWPGTLASGAETLDLCALADLQFLPPDDERFPCLAAGRRAAEAGGIMPATVNAANEEAVAAFLSSRLRFDLIARVVAEVMAAVAPAAADSLATVLAADARARVLAREFIARGAELERGSPP